MRTRVSVLKKVFLVECIVVFLLLLSKGILLIEKTEVMTLYRKSAICFRTKYLVLLLEH